MLGIFLPLLPQCCDYSHLSPHREFLHLSWSSNSDSCMCEASTLLLSSHYNTFLSKDIYFILCILVFCLHACLQCLHRPEEGVRSPRPGITDSSLLACECWEQNLGPLEEQTLLLIAEPPLHPSNIKQG